MSEFQQGIHKLPVELLDLVLQSLWADKRTILACSWVSRLWHEVARPHLFAFLKIASHFDFVGFDAFLHANIDIARRLRKLQLRHAITTWMDHSKLPDGFLGVERAHLRDLVASLPRLQELHLCRLWMISSSNPAPDSPKPLPMHRLEKLTIDYCRAPDGYSSLVTVLSTVLLFASVDTVELVSLRLPIVPHDRTRILHTVNVGTLIITDIYLPPQFEASALYDPLREFLAPGCIRSLEIGCLHSHQPELSARTDRVAREQSRWTRRGRSRCAAYALQICRATRAH